MEQVRVFITRYPYLILMIHGIVSVYIRSYLGEKTILYTAKHDQSATIMPIIRIEFGRLTINGNPLMIWNIGGRSAYRLMRRQYYEKLSAFIFVVDSTDHQRIDQAREQLHQLTNDENFRDKSILIFANKQDLSDAMNSDQLRDKLQLDQLKKNIKWHIQPASSNQNQRLHQDLEWLMDSIREKNYRLNPFVETFNDTVTMKNDLISKFRIDHLTALVKKAISLSFYSMPSLIKFVDIK